MTTETVSLSQVAEILAHGGYDVSEAQPGVLRVREIQSGVSFQAALEGNVLYMTVTLTTVSRERITPALMELMLSGQNGISTSSFRLFPSGEKTAITLSNFCKLQDMGPEDRDDILSLAGYLLADVIEARDLLQPAVAAR